MNKKELQTSLSIMGRERSLDIISFAVDHGWSTATEISHGLDMHVATAVKHLQDLESIDVLESRTRKGKTRSALEYNIKNSRIFYDIDIMSLGSQGEMEKDNDLHLSMVFLCEFSQRLMRFTGNTTGSLLESWKKDLGLDDAVLGHLRTCIDSYEPDDENRSSGLADKMDGLDHLQIIDSILEFEERTMGRSSLISLVNISLARAFKDMKMEEEGSNSSLYKLINKKYSTREVEK